MRFYIVDCFAREKYQGNPLLVVIPDRAVSDAEQQAIAREINFSETAFILSGKQPDGGYAVRIWTPNVGEVPFAGHPTLGTAHVIHQALEGGAGEEVRLNLKVGQIRVKVTPQGLTMAQNSPEFGAVISREELAPIYGISPEEIREDYPIQWASTGLESVIIPLKSRQTLAGLTIDRDKFNAYVARRPACYCNHLFFVDMGRNVLAVRCLMENFVEDPATGSANGDLAGYLLEHDYFGKREAAYTVLQGEDMGRPSVLQIQAKEAEGRWLIEVGGRCHIVAQGDWA